MLCVTCRNGETFSGTTTVVLHLGDTILVVKKVPANICENCGEYYLDEKVTAEVYKKLADALERHVEVAILSYQAEL